MPSAKAPSSAFDHSARANWWLLVGSAAGIYLVLESLDVFLALPLRESSAVIASGILNLLGCTVERQGTILVTDDFSWDVVPACSGSTTLRVLLMSTIIWCGVQPGLTRPRKLLCIVAAIPVALLANGIRVAALTYLGAVFLKPIDGALHDLIGVAAVMLSMGAVIMLTAFASGGPVQAPMRRSVQLGLLTLLVLLLAAPALAWLGNAWITSPTDQNGIFFSLLSLAVMLVFWFRTPLNGDSRRPATWLFAAGLLLLSAATVAEISLLKALIFPSRMTPSLNFMCCLCRPRP